VPARDTVARAAADTNESAGEVVSDSISAPVKERWITDANILALLGAMNAREIAAADVELEAWHSDTVRAFAASMARDHAELQHSVDSLTERLGVMPATPALAKPWLSSMQIRMDSVQQARGDALDRAFVREEVATHQLMSDYVQQLAAAAERPELRAFLETTASRVASELARARSMQATVAASDSAAAARAARTRRPQGR
jgi:putative membrane protein